MAIIT